MKPSLLREILFRFLQLPFVLALFVFLPAGTLEYWQGWAFGANFTLCTLFVTIYLAKKDPALLQRRLKAGPTAEKEPIQKIIMLFAFLSFAAMVVLSSLDHRWGWSQVPLWAVGFGHLLIVIGFAFVTRVMRENTFSASTIQIAENQRVIATGPYASARHPMYSGGLILILGMAPALGSWWGLMMFLPATAAIIWRLLDEEKFLAKNLRGYVEYTQKVRYRLIPGLW